ncbi:hypothetical protein K503DRAFT_705351 [Rhizopogon vinicolor AM-OR11-026]|uniref:Conidiation protein 6 n=1 Tax=Rhizopogon vinicolor AM-OR11-026 TaxID=1314800 RepID=A0A1B7NJ52_9AGAM|nr:hypothetical protein K503DRAFT_705351 [Rhizopogon vinicolor AM-OR11-026]
MQSQANPANVAGGHKAVLKNPKVSEEAKEHSQQILKEMELRGELPAPEQNRGADESKNIGNIIGGHKAATKNPNVSEEAKEHSKQFLEDIGA